MVTSSISLRPGVAVLVMLSIILTAAVLFPVIEQRDGRDFN
jgi:hypothetical protein